MKYEQIALESERIYDGAVIKVRKDKALMPDGTTALREVVEHNGGVGIALEDTDGTYYLVKQWRYGQKCTMIEFPAGKKEVGEDPFETATREIIEETGYEGVDWHYLGKMVPTPAYDEEVIDLYYAKQGNFVGQHLDEDEYLEVYKMTLPEIIDAIMKGDITDGKTIAMAFMIKEMKERETK